MRRAHAAGQGGLSPHIFPETRRGGAGARNGHPLSLSRRRCRADLATQPPRVRAVAMGLSIDCRPHALGPDAPMRSARYGRSRPLTSARRRAFVAPNGRLDELGASLADRIVAADHRAAVASDDPRHRSTTAFSERSGACAAGSHTWLPHPSNRGAGQRRASRRFSGRDRDTPCAARVRIRALLRAARRSVTSSRASYGGWSEAGTDR